MEYTACGEFVRASHDDPAEYPEIQIVSIKSPVWKKKLCAGAMERYIANGFFELDHALEHCLEEWMEERR